MIASHIARSMKAFAIAEKLILPSAIDLCRKISYGSETNFS